MPNFGLFPSIAYFAKAYQSNLWIPFSNQENSFYEIGGANQIETLRIPITHGSKNNTPELWEISYQHKWIKEHKNAWKTAYGKSPFYAYYDYKLERILDQHIPSFKDLQITLLQELIPWIGFEDIPVLHETRTIDPLESTSYVEYYQVFETKFQHRKNLSIIDLIFNLGPEAISYFRKYSK
jgi:hypothetical protein